MGNSFMVSIYYSNGRYGGMQLVRELFKQPIILPSLFELILPGLVIIFDDTPGVGEMKKQLRLLKARKVV
jgi:hypothetical protein